MEGDGRHAASSGDVSRHGKTMAYVDVGRRKCCGSGVKESAKVSETVGANLRGCGSERESGWSRP